MADAGKDTEKLRKLVSLLPGENCGKCGFENCGAFAVALAGGKASPLDCRKSRSSIEEICGVLGIEVPEGTASASEGHSKGHHGVHHGHHGGGHHHKHGR